MSSTDWRDALKAMLPDDYTPEPEPATASTERPKPVLTITLDRKRAGKTATIISGFDADDERAASIAAELKRHLASGGSQRDGEILIQGDRVKQVADYLRAKGYKTR